MKKLMFILLAVMLLVFMIGYSQEIHYGEQHTVTWNAATHFENGNPIPPEYGVTYMVYLQDRDTLEIIVVLELPETVLTITHDRGVQVVGVSAIVEYPDGHKAENPDITWSTMTDTERVPVPFYAAFYEVAAVVTGFEYIPIP